MNRYSNLSNSLAEIAATGAARLNFLEVGTYDGVRAAALLRAWLAGGSDRSASYIGFDLFEQCTPALAVAELSKTRLPPAKDAVEKLLRATGASVSLFRGFTRETLTAWCALPTVAPNLIFVDGGHSLDTIASDWAAIASVMRKDTVVLLDDYYENRQDYGCRVLVDELQKSAKYRVALLDPVDRFAHTKCDIRMVRVWLV